MDNISFPNELAHILNALYSLKKGTMFAHKYKKWIQLANQVLTYHTQFSGIFIKALTTYGLFEQVSLEDRNRTFRSKLEKVKMGVKHDDPDFVQNLQFRPLFKVLFPELMTDK